MDDKQVQEIFVEDIIPNRFQPRLTFDEKALKELSESIKVHGVIQPLVLRKVGNKYEIIAGERRYKASCMAGLKTVPAIVKDMTDNQSAEVALIENVQRKNLSSIEEAKSYKNLLERGYLTQDELAKKIGVTQSTIANRMRLLNLCEEVQNALLNEQISERHARSLLQLSNPDDQKKMLDRIIKERMTVRQLDIEIKKLLNSSNESSDSQEDDKPISLEPNKNNVGDNIMNQDNQSNNFVNNQSYSNNMFFNSNDLQPSPMPQVETNLFGMPINNDLEGSVPNMNTGISDNVPPATFNPFTDNVVTSLDNENITNNQPVSSFENTEIKTDNFETDKSINTNNLTNDVFQEPIETFNIFGDPIVEEVAKKEEIQEPVKNIGDEINKVRNIINDIKASGFSVTSEEYDLNTDYQIVIKIKKEN